MVFYSWIFYYLGEGEGTYMTTQWVQEFSLGYRNKIFTRAMEIMRQMATDMDFDLLNISHWSCVSNLTRTCIKKFQINHIQGMCMLINLFFMFSNFHWLDSHNKMCIASAHLWWNVNKKQTYFDLGMVIISAYLLNHELKTQVNSWLRSLLC